MDLASLAATHLARRVLRGRSSFKALQCFKTLPGFSRRFRRLRPAPLSHPRSRNRPLVDLGEVVAGSDKEVLVGGTDVVAGSEVVAQVATTKMPCREKEKLKNEDEPGSASANENVSENESRKAKKHLAKIATILFPPASPGPRVQPQPSHGTGHFHALSHTSPPTPRRGVATAGSPMVGCV
jgi:hypothetical protein